MGLIGKSTNVTVSIAGQLVQLPKEMFDTSVLASFDDGNIQANISTEDGLTFILDAYTKIKEHISGGVGIFEGVPIRIDAFNKDQGRAIFDGFIDLAESAQIDDTTGQIIAPIKKLSGLNNLADQIAPLDFEQLYNEGFITDSDFVTVDYVVESTTFASDALVSSLVLYQLTKQLAESTQQLADQIATASGIASSSLSGSVGALVYNLLKIAALAAYNIALISIIIRLGNDLVSTFIPPKKQHKGITLSTMLTAVCTKLGYTLNTTITDLEYIVYLPSNIKADLSLKSVFIDKTGTITKGIPNINDYGYLCEQIFELVRNLFNARYTLTGNTVQLHTELSPFWQKQSTYTLPDKLEGVYRYNTEELAANILISFQTDIQDLWTLENYEGTAYQVITTAKTVSNQQMVNIKNLQEVSIPLALGNRKDKLNPFESFLSSILSVFDTITGILGSGTNFSSKIKSKVGVLKVGNNNHSVPKLLYIEGGKIPSDHRTKLSAKVLWDNYHYERSFVLNNYRRQRKIFSGVKIPFGFVDFIKVIDNSYIYDSSGNKGKITRIEWQFLKDYALIDYYLESKYTANLQEQYVEPS